MAGLRYAPSRFMMISAHDYAVDGLGYNHTVIITTALWHGSYGVVVRVVSGTKVYIGTRIDPELYGLRKVAGLEAGSTLPGDAD